MVESLFAEEAGLILQAEPKHADRIIDVFQSAYASSASSPHPYVRVHRIGTVSSSFSPSSSSSSSSSVAISFNDEEILRDSLSSLRQKWEETSFQLERLQTNPACVEEEERMMEEQEEGPRFCWNRRWRAAEVAKVASAATVEEEEEEEIEEKTEEERKEAASNVPLSVASSAPKVAILREEGSNGDREMAAAFHAAGFRVFDVAMTDVTSGRVSDGWMERERAGRTQTRE